MGGLCASGVSRALELPEPANRMRSASGLKSIAVSPDKAESGVVTSRRWIDMVLKDWGVLKNSGNVLS